MPARMAARGLVALALAAALSMPAAATAGAGTPAPPEPWEPGDLVWEQDAAPLLGDTVERAVAGESCQRLPLLGYVAGGGFAATPLRYSSTWRWSAGSAYQPFSWTIRTGSGVLKAQGSSSWQGGQATVSANNHTLRIHNRGVLAQAWTVCWS